MYTVFGLAAAPSHPHHGAGRHPHGGGGGRSSGGRVMAVPVVEGGPYVVLDHTKGVSVYIQEGNVWTPVAENVVPEEADRVARSWRAKGTIVKIV